MILLSLVMEFKTQKFPNKKGDGGHHLLTRFTLSCSARRGSADTSGSASGGDRRPLCPPRLQTPCDRQAPAQDPQQFPDPAKGH